MTEANLYSNLKSERFSSQLLGAVCGTVEVGGGAASTVWTKALVDTDPARKYIETVPMADLTTPDQQVAADAESDVTLSLGLEEEKDLTMVSLYMHFVQLSSKTLPCATYLLKASKQIKTMCYIQQVVVV
jgi:phosphoribosylformimino-5-aminoimidazole carboxamide ribonucleotide (ProFAR) isomerase